MLLDDIGARLVAQNVAGGATGWNLAKSFIPETPDQVVSIMETGGQVPNQFETSAGGIVTFQVQVRGAEFEYDVARTKMAAAFTALNQANIAGYVFVYALQSAPLSLGIDQNNRPELALNFEARITAL